LVGFYDQPDVEAVIKKSNQTIQGATQRGWQADGAPGATDDY
jgi:hypothetical protein